jgi:hypothetical protein
MVKAEFAENAIYDIESLAKSLDIHRVKIKTAVRRGELRGTHRAGTIFFRGRWILDWLNAAPKPVATDSSELAESTP